MEKQGRIRAKGVLGQSWGNVIKRYRENRPRTFRLRSRGCRQPPLTADVWCSGAAGSPGRRRCAPRARWIGTPASSKAVAGDSLREALSVNVVSKSEDTGSARFDGTAAVLALRGRTRKRPPLLPG